MNSITQLIIAVYSRSLALYPRRFKNEFADEMHGVFSDSLNEASREGTFSFLFLCLKEFGGLPFHILRESWYEIERREPGMVNDNSATETGLNGEQNRWDAFIGTLPFVLFGVASMLSRTRYPFSAYSHLAFYAVVLPGLLIGMIKGFPRWAYGFLGWAMVFAWWWTDMHTNGLRIFGYTMGNEGWGWRIWYPLVITIAIAILWTRSLRPIRQMVSGIWQDWTLLSLAIYAFVAFTVLIYDENHHPYLLVFIAASTLVICMAVWVFLQSPSSWKRVIALIAGFVGTLILSNISYLNNMSYATRDYAAYHGLSLAPPQPWYTAAFDGIIGWTLLYSGIMYWPVVIGLVRHIINNRQKSGMA